jgi:phosphatidylinositol 4-kinase
MSSHEQSTAFEVLVQIMPALHGFYRGVSSTPYKWDISQWRRVSQELKKLCFNDVVEKLNHLLVNILQNGDADAKTLQFVQTFVSRYISEGRPLSGYFIVCCVIETEWTILAQVLVPSLKTAVIDVEAAAANKAWVALLRDEITDVNQFSDEDRSAIRSIMAYAMQCFTDFFDQVQEMESEPSIDTYAWETMSESLVSTFHFEQNLSR